MRWTSKSSTNKRMKGPEIWYQEDQIHLVRPVCIPSSYLGPRGGREASRRPTLAQARNRPAMAMISLDALLLWAAILAGLALTRLPYEELPGSGGALVPSVFFRDEPAGFYAFVLALVLSASSAAGAIMHRRSFPGYASLCRRAAVASMVAAFGALLWVSWRSAWIPWGPKPGTIADG
ncbi:hypothetical protein Cni_G17842 [Canna indica]|uniref:Uncharacterized protein n=1 Tax=Canna indica TaxID=4628 RepID=A0AAQ3QFI8_9LILI|nr:hypothetical protein Cni_G17842 [Canna indica]